MLNHSKIKKAVTGILSTALLASSFTSIGAGTAVSAADDYNYAEALALSMYFYDANACGTGITDGPLTWRGDCHTYDQEASLSSAVNFDSSAKSLVDPDGDGKVDVSGGYHDAGDHIKFNVTIGFSMTGLAMSDYLNPGAYEKAGCRDHLIANLRRGADYLMKTTFLNESGDVKTICYLVSDESDHSIWTAPEVQTYNRPTYWLTSSKNNSVFCGEMASALAGTALILKESDPEYAAECAKYAKAIHKFGNAHTGNMTDGQGSMYSTDAMYQDEMAIAEFFLWQLGEGSKPSYTPTGNGCYNNTYYDYYLFCWDKVWAGYSTLMYKATGDSAFAKEMEFGLNNMGGCPTSSYNAAGWGASRYNCALQMVALGLANGDANSNYAKGAKFQMDHILGNNSRGYSFLIGYGDKWPTHIHHRAANPGSGNQTSADNPSSKYVLYGALIGGDDSNGSYEDHADRYQFTEPALDYNACFALACAGLVNLYGGDSSATEEVINSASEINADYKFASDTDPIPPSESDDILYGDANCDGEVNMADAVIIMQSIACPDLYGIDGSDNSHITAQGQKNADVSGNNDGVTNKDALAIQKYKLNLITELPEK